MKSNAKNSNQRNVRISSINRTVLKAM